MSTAEIHNYVRKPEEKKYPIYHGHLMEVPLSDGNTALIDPEQISAVSGHRDNDQLTVITMRRGTHLYYVDASYDDVKKWISDALE